MAFGYDIRDVIQNLRLRDLELQRQIHSLRTAVQMLGYDVSRGTLSPAVKEFIDGSNPRPPADCTTEDDLGGFPEPRGGHAHDRD